METKEVVKVMSSYVNSMSTNYSEFAELMSYEHKTLQQNFTKVCVEWLKKLSTTEYYDLRNEGSVKFAKSISKQLDEVCLPLI